MMNQSMNDIHCQSKSIPLVSKKWNMKTWLRCIYISQNPLFQTLIFQGDKTILNCHPCCQTLEKSVSIRAVVGREAVKRAHFSVNPNRQRLNPLFLQTKTNKTKTSKNRNHHHHHHFASFCIITMNQRAGKKNAHHHQGRWSCPWRHESEVQRQQVLRTKAQMAAPCSVRCSRFGTQQRNHYQRHCSCAPCRCC